MIRFRNAVSRQILAPLRNNEAWDRQWFDSGGCAMVG